MPDPPITPKDALDGVALRDMFASGMAWLETQVDYVNSLNVFPVPDGDTGTNLLLTMRSALTEGSRIDTTANAWEMAAALAQGALMGARGNAGVIFSQIMRGFEQGVQGKGLITAADLPAAFGLASYAAYRAVSTPVEGTILTVIREVAADLDRSGRTETTLASALRLAANTAQEWVARTPDMMPLLRENGVVDSGAQALAFILDGMSHYAAGDMRIPPPIKAFQSSHTALQEQPQFEGQRYGSCTEFFIEDSAFGVDAVRQEFQVSATSVMVAGGQNLIKVHLHTLDPETFFARARVMGTLGPTKVEDMDAQHREWQRKRSASRSIGKTSVVAVAAGAGLEELFRSLGAEDIIRGGQTMNPSAQEILTAILAAPTPEVLVLPNNKNIVLAANQAKAMAGDRRVAVVPTSDIPQGISAMIGFNYEVGAVENASAMTIAFEETKTGELSWAVRDTQFNGREISLGDAIGLVNGRLVSANADTQVALEHLLETLQVDDDSTVTLYFGESVSAQQADEARRRLLERYPRAEVQAFAGGQPTYSYFVSVE